jgi:predicted tellurium resistance membrane protein TerC
MGWLSSPEAWVALTTLTALEIVLGVDNIIFVTILVGRVPEAQRQRARILGLAFAMVTRILLLLLLTWIMRIQATLFTTLGVDISGRDLILIGGGLFLIAKATLEIHSSLEAAEQEAHAVGHAGFLGVIVQIGLIDIVFSLDSVITAVGLANDVSVMVVAIVLAVIAMMFAAGAIGRFVDDHPTVKMLALSFLVLIGVALIAEGADVHLPKSYIYFAMAFSVVVEMLNLRVRRGRRPIQLKKKEP